MQALRNLGVLHHMATYRGDRIKQTRERQGMRQYELAIHADLSQGHLSQIERNRLDSVGTDILSSIAHALGTNVEYLLGNSDDPRPVKRQQLGQLSPEEEDLLKSYRALREQVFRSMAVDSVKSLLKAEREIKVQTSPEDDERPVPAKQ